MTRMKAYASFDEYQEGQSPANQAIIRALRQFVKRSQPRLTEAVKWGNGCWIGGHGPVAYVYSAAGYVQFGFFRGSALLDPRGLLEGKGEYVRHIKVHDASGIDERAFRALLRQAVRADPSALRSRSSVAPVRPQKRKATPARKGPRTAR